MKCIYLVVSLLNRPMQKMLQINKTDVYYIRPAINVRFAESLIHDSLDGVCGIENNGTKLQNKGKQIKE